MDLLVNDLSFHGQFADALAFEDAISRMMKIRVLAKQHGRDLHCHKNLLSARATFDQIIPQIIQTFSLERKRSLMLWLTRQGRQLLCVF